MSEADSPQSGRTDAQPPSATLDADDAGMQLLEGFLSRSGAQAVVATVDEGRRQATALRAEYANPEMTDEYIERKTALNWRVADRLIANATADLDVADGRADGVIRREVLEARFNVMKQNPVMQAVLNEGLIAQDEKYSSLSRTSSPTINGRFLTPEEAAADPKAAVIHTVLPETITVAELASRMQHGMRVAMSNHLVATPVSLTEAHSQPPAATPAQQATARGAEPTGR